MVHLSGKQKQKAGLQFLTKRNEFPESGITNFTKNGKMWNVTCVNDLFSLT